MEIPPTGLDALMATLNTFVMRPTSTRLSITPDMSFSSGTPRAPLSGTAGSDHSRTQSVSSLEFENPAVSGTDRPTGGGVGGSDGEEDSGSSESSDSLTDSSEGSSGSYGSACSHGNKEQGEERQGQVGGEAATTAAAAASK